MPPKPKDELQITHTELLDFIDVIGYDSLDFRGECFGLTHVAILYALMNNLDVYIERLRQIKELYDAVYKEALSGHINRTREDIQNAFSQRLDSFGEYDNGRLVNLIKASILAFCDSVLILSRPWRYPELYPEGEAPKGQDFETTYRYVRPTISDIKAVSGEHQFKIWYKKLFCGFYRFRNLVKLFSDLRFRLMSYNLSAPVCFRLSNNEHTLLITYNTSNDKWMMFDSGTPIEYDGNESRALGSAIFEAFRIVTGIACKTIVYTLKKDARVIQEAIGELSVLWNSEKIHIFPGKLLAVASENGQIDVVRHVLSQEENNANLINKSEALIFAAQSGELEIVKVLSNAAKSYVSEWFEETLREASSNGHSEVVNYLLEEIVDKAWLDTNLATACVNAAFVIACECGRIDVVKVFASSGMQINSQDKHGRTGLIEAARHNHIQIMVILLDNGAAVGTKNASLQSALHVATGYGHFQAVALLLSRGARIRQVTGGGCSALDITFNSGREDIICLLIKYGAKKLFDPNDWDFFKDACELGYVDVIAALIERGFKCNLVADDARMTPLCQASLYGQGAIVKLLLREGANSLATIEISQHELLGIARQHERENYLAQLFAVYNIKKQDSLPGMTALDVAIIHGRKEVVKVLLRAMPRSNLNDGPICRIALAMAIGELEIARMLSKATRADVFQREFFAFYTPDMNAEDRNHIDTGWVATPHLVTALVAKNPDSRIARAYRLKQCHDALLVIYKGDRQTFYYHAHRLSKRLQVGLSHRTLNSSSIREHCSAQDFILLHKQIERLREIMNPAHPQYDRRAASRLYLYSGIEINPETSTLDIIRVCLNQGQDYRPRCALPSGGFNDFARAYHKMRRSL